MILIGIPSRLCSECLIRCYSLEGWLLVSSGGGLPLTLVGHVAVPGLFLDGGHGGSL